MDQASSAIQSGAPPRPAAPGLLSAWSLSVQLGLGFLVMAGLFFLLGRWSNEATPVALAMHESSAPALDVNRATRAELRLIPGIGDALAQRIIEHRDRLGAFKSVDELRQVYGIGPKTLERIRAYLFVAAHESFVSDAESDAMPEPSKVPVPRTTSLKASQLKEPININKADQVELQKLPGIGPKLAQRILDERGKAPFKSIDELRRVFGIGAKTLEKLRPHATIK